MKDVIFYQLFESESSTYTYIIGDAKTREVALIDPVLETVDRDLKFISELGVTLKYVLDTHVHADHITGADVIRKRTGAKTAVSAEAHVDCVDIPLQHGQEIFLGDKKIKALATPGHTNSCMSFLFEDMVFTGDVLLIRGTGRTDFQQGSSDKMYQSIISQLFTLPDSIRVYPAHDYRGHTSSTIGQEKTFNPRIGNGKTLEEFKKIMSELKLANPKKIHEAVPANMACGKPKDSRTLHPQIVDGVPEVTVEDVQLNKSKLKLIDVRGPDEFHGELGHIPGSAMRVLGDELLKFLQEADKTEEIVFVCRSGARSGRATLAAKEMGFKFVSNMAGGMLRWNELKYPTEK